MDDKRILSDDDFTQLMEADYEVAGEPVDEIMRERVLQAVHRRLSPAKRRKFFYGQVGALAAVLVVGLTYFVTRQTEELTRDKGEGLPLSVNLAVFTLEDDGSLAYVEDVLPVGTTVVIKVNPASEVFGALVILEENKAARVELAGKSYQAGEEVVLGEGDDVFGYRFSEAAVVKFCFLAASDTHQLRLWTAEVTTQILQHAKCQTIRAGATAGAEGQGTP